MVAQLKQRVVLMESQVEDWHGFQKLVMALLLVGAMNLEEECCVQLVKGERYSRAGAQQDIEVALKEQQQQLQAERDMQHLEFLQFDEVRGSQVKWDIGFQTLDTSKARLVLCFLILMRN